MPRIGWIVLVLLFNAAQALAQPPEPTWPQRFDLGTGQHLGFQFVVGQPGKIILSVQ